MYKRPEIHLSKCTVVSMIYQQVLLFVLLAVGKSVSGEDAKPDEFPYQVLLQVGSISESGSMFGRQSCGGAILNEKWILTSGKCVAYFDLLSKTSNEPFLVQAGKYRQDLNESTEQNSTAKNYFAFPKYSVGPRDDQWNYVDIGLIKLSSPLKLNSHAAAAELPMVNSEPTGEGISTGWSATINRDSPAMQKTKTSIVDYKMCNKAYDKIYRQYADKRVRSLMREYDIKKLVYEYNVCTEAANSDGIDNCNYAPGSPLITKREDGKVEVVGVRSSIASPTCVEPLIYVKVSSVVDWIVKTMAANS